MQREVPVAAGGRTHVIRHQADVQFGEQPWHKRQLYEVQLTSGCDSTVRGTEGCSYVASLAVPTLT